MTMCTVKEIQEAIREDCKSQHDMESTDMAMVNSSLFVTWNGQVKRLETL